MQKDTHMRNVRVAGSSRCPSSQGEKQDMFWVLGARIHWDSHDPYYGAFVE